MIEIEHHNVGLAAVDTRMRRQVLDHPPLVLFASRAVVLQ